MVLLLGLLLAVSSVLVVLLPVTVSRVTGLTALGGPIGYLFVTSVIAVQFQVKWYKIFISTFTALSTAIIAFYLFQYTLFRMRPPGVRILLTSHQGFPPLPITFNVATTVFIIFQWLAISFILCLFISTILWANNQLKQRLLKLLIQIVIYVSFIVAIYFESVRHQLGCFIFEMEWNLQLIRQYIGLAFEIIYQIGMIILFHILWRRTKHRTREV